MTGPRPYAKPRRGNVIDLPTSYAPPVGCLTASQVVEKVPGLSYRQIHYWASLRYLRPISHPDPGSGYQIVYDAAEVAVITVMAALVADGFTPKVAARVARELLEAGHTRLAGLRVELPEVL